MAKSRIVVQPDPRRKRVQVDIASPGAEFATVEIGELGARVEGAIGSPIILNFADFIPWTPTTPKLYTLRCTTGGQAGLALTFGMREVSVQEQRFTINQRPLVLKGIRYTHGTDDPAEYLARLAGMGFNWIRCRAADAHLDEILGHADATGLLVSVALGSSIAEMTDLVSRIHHHPALVFWEAAEPMIAQLRRLDVTRPVVEAGGKSGAGRVFRPFHAESERLEYIDVRPLCPVSRETESFLVHLGHTSALNVVNVHGLNAAATPASVDLIPVLAESARTCAEHLRANPRVGGFCFESSIDAPAAATAVTDGQAPVRAVITLARSNLVPREEVDVSVVLLNEAKLEGRGELSLQVIGPTNQTLWKKKRGAKIPKHGKELWTGTVAASGSIGPHRFVVQLWTEKGLVGEGQAPFFVTPPVDAWRGAIDVLDPANRWIEPIKRLAPQIDATAKVIVVPPLARSIRAYPDNALGQVLGRVREGAVAIFFTPPADWAELAATLSSPLLAESHDLLADDISTAAWLGRLHPIFEGLPAGGPMGRPYRGVLTRWAIAGDGEEDVAPAHGASNATGAAISVRKFGNGRILFSTMRLLDRIGQDPVADRLFVNLLRYSERRALPFQGIARAEMKAVEWLRPERAKLRAWRVIGPFPNPDGTGHAEAYPPESSFDADAAYRGLFRAVSWMTHHQGPKEIDKLDLAVTVAPNTFRTNPLAGTYYAYAELGGDARSEPTLTVRHSGSAKCWVNGRLAYASAPERVMDDAGGDFVGPVVLKQGRNTVLVKVSVAHAEPAIELRVTQRDGEAGWRWQ